jgi:hypothetical protein
MAATERRSSSSITLPITLIQLSVVFMGHSRQIPGMYLKLDHKRFLSHPFQFIIQISDGTATRILTVRQRYRGSTSGGVLFCPRRRNRRQVHPGCSGERGRADGT